jgi:hypothetical protein
MQPSLAQTVVDGPLAEAKARELSSRQNTVLLLRQVGNRAVRLVSSQLTPIYVVNCELAGHRPRMAPRGARVAREG